MLNRRGFLGLFCLAWGCGQSPAPAPAPAKRIASQHNAPLSDDDVETFLAIVQELPGKAPPAFQPVAELDLSSDRSANEMVARWQREFRSASSPAVQGKQWRRDVNLRRAIEDQGWQPEQLAGHIVKLSAAVVRESLDPQLDLAAMGHQADRAIEALCRQIDGLDRSALAASIRNSRYEFLTASLKEAVAYREFLRMIEAVPADSVRIAARHRAELRRLLPPSETVKTFERRLESQAIVTPASHQSTDRPSTTRR